MKRIRTKINEKWVDENGILRIRVIEGAFVDLVSLKEDAAVNQQLTGGKKALALYDARNFFTITSEATEYTRSGILNKERIATAILTDRLGMRLLVNFINKLKKPETPVKMFGKEEDALTWLLSFRN